MSAQSGIDLDIITRPEWDGKEYLWNADLLQSLWRHGKRFHRVEPFEESAGQEADAFHTVYRRNLFDQAVDCVLRQLVDINN